jgi:hypothetical protein
MHPRGLRCSSIKYRRYSQSSRLAREAPHPSRCDARLPPRAAMAGLWRSRCSGGHPEHPDKTRSRGLSWNAPPLVVPPETSGFRFETGGSRGPATRGWRARFRATVNPCPGLGGESAVAPREGSRAGFPHLWKTLWKSARKRDVVRETPISRGLRRGEIAESPSDKALRRVVFVNPLQLRPPAGAKVWKPRSGAALRRLH